MIELVGTPRHIVELDGIGIDEVDQLRLLASDSVQLWWRGSDTLDVFCGAGGLREATAAPLPSLVVVPGLGRAPSVLARELTAISVLVGVAVPLVLDGRMAEREVVRDAVEILTALAAGKPASYLGSTASITGAPNLPGPPGAHFVLTVLACDTDVDALREELGDKVAHWVLIPATTGARPSSILNTMVFSGAAHEGVVGDYVAVATFDEARAAVGGVVR